MGRITTSVGLATGFPITDTVDKLIAVEAKQRDQLSAQSQRITNQKNAYTQLAALAVGMQLTAVRLASASLYNQRTEATSDATLLTAKVSDGASPAIGQYSFRPVQTAQSQQLQSTRFASKTAAVGAGNFSIAFGGFLDHAVSLDELRQGQGFERGKIKITDRSGATAEIDLTYARTIDDVLQAINANGGVNVQAETAGDRLRLVDKTGDTSSNLRVQEVGNGSTAASLGLAGINIGAASAVGNDVLGLFSDLSLNRLNDGVGLQFDDVLPDLKVTFRDGTDATLDLHKLEVKGSKATATTTGVNGANAKAIFTAVKGGSAYDNVVIRFVDNTSVVKGTETVSYDDSNPSLKTLTFQIRSDKTTAKDIVNALNSDETAKKIFTAALPSGSSGSGLVSVEDSVATTGGAVVEPVAGGNESTVGDILTALNSVAPTKLQAKISSDGKRIELTDLSNDTGGAFSVVDLNHSKVASDLGITATAVSGVIAGKRVLGGLKTSLIASLNGGAGLGTLGSLSLTDQSGATGTVDLSSAETVDDIIDAINSAGVGVRASINTARNGITIVDTTGSSASNLIIANGDLTNSADKLGIAFNGEGTKSSGNLKLKTVGENTLLASLYGGAGVNQGAFTITDSTGAKGTVNINDATKTIGDAIHAINSLGLSIQAKINDAGDGIAVIDTAHGSGVLTVAELGGTTAKALRLLNPVQTVSISGQPTQVIDGSTTVAIEVSGSNSLEDVAKKINDLGLGVRASIISDGSTVKPLRLSLTNERTGTASTISIDTSIAGLSFNEVVQARDALLAVGDVAAGSGYLASSATNTFSDAVPDVAVTIKGTSDHAVTVSVDSSNENLTKAVQAFVDSYNKLHSKIDELTAYDSEKDQAAVLQGDSTVLRLQSDISSLFSGRISNAGPLQALQSVGITLKQDGSLAFDSAQLGGKFATNPADVKSFFSRSTYGLSARVKKLGDQVAGVGNSLLIGRTVTLDSKLTSLQDRIAFWNEKLDRDREALLNKFYASEAAISKLKNNTSFLSTLSSVASNFNSN